MGRIIPYIMENKACLKPPTKQRHQQHFLPEKQVLRPLTEKQVPQVDSEEKHLGLNGEKGDMPKSCQVVTKEIQ